MFPKFVVNLVQNTVRSLLSEFDFAISETMSEKCTLQYVKSSPHILINEIKLYRNKSVMSIFCTDISASHQQN